MPFEIWRNSFKKNIFPRLFIENFIYLFVNNLLKLLLLCQINGLDAFNTDNFFQIFAASRTTAISIV